MAFWGNSFIFNDIPCEDFELMIYNIDNNTQSAGKFASNVEAVEDQIPGRWKPFFYNTKMTGKLSFSIVFGVNQERIDEEKYLDRYELEAIASWLTGHNKYHWLEVQQEDLEYARYKCIITELKQIEYGNLPWALQATVTCDSPYAYLYPQVFEYTVTNEETIQFFNESSHNGFYMPKIEFSVNSGNLSGGFSITNLSDDGRKTEFKGTTQNPIPTSVTKVEVDNDTGIITSNDGTNMYPYFNFKFLRLLRGNNSLKITGSGTLKIFCEFPINMGG
ncbi:MAG: hypothetical protein IJT38_05555 [Clostridia bacterium]|nr:hypothetical protein [Clostridia bacterium]